MKIALNRKIVLLLITSIPWLPLVAQQKIVLKNGEVITNATLSDKKPLMIVYKKDGSLHDLEIAKIKWIEKQTADQWVFINDSLVLDATGYSENRAVMKDSSRSMNAEEKEIKTLLKGNLLERGSNGNYYLDSLSASRLTPGQLYEEGRKDAKHDFHAPLSTVLGVASVPFIYTLIVPGVTLVQVAIPPNIYNQGIPLYLSSNSNYADGFRRQAVHKKLSNAGKGFGITAGAIVTAIVIAFVLHPGF